MKLSDFEFFLREGWTSFWRSGLMSIVSVGTITLSLIVFGFFMLIFVNVNHLVNSMSNKLEIVLYIKNLETTDQFHSLKSRVENVPGIKEVTFISKNTAWQQFKKTFESRLSLEGVMANNPLPDSFVIKVDSLTRIPQVAEALSSFPEVDDIRYGGELAARVNKFAQMMKLGGGMMVLLLGMATLLIVINTIRLTVLARNDEISIMKLVGATDMFIKWPFIVEGLFIGTCGAVISMLFLKLAYMLLLPQIQESLPFLPLVASEFVLNIIYLNVIVAGILLGLLGAHLSVSKSLKVLDEKN